jgi:hypothetical protein
MQPTIERQAATEFMSSSHQTESEETFMIDQRCPHCGTANKVFGLRDETRVLHPRPAPRITCWKCDKTFATVFVAAVPTNHAVAAKPPPAAM